MGRDVARHNRIQTINRNGPNTRWIEQEGNDESLIVLISLFFVCPHKLYLNL